uniref:7TM GPCR serpentine receptor class x (Srx) domain-containing protein n=1 Tax=Strongyloides stercoralis TaxID=6248 RepID=A0A0K0E0W6_STRER
MAAQLNDRCFYGKIHILTAMKLFITLGISITTGIIIFELFHFRRALFVNIIPIFVIVSTVGAILKNSSKLVWPIVGISFFHLFLAANSLLIFLFYFIFKPLYIIMVFNWAFKTMHGDKTLSFYIYSFIIILFLIIVLIFSIWQAKISLRFINYIELTINNFDNQNCIKKVVQTGGTEILSIPVNYSNTNYVSDEIKRTIM